MAIQDPLTALIIQCLNSMSGTMLRTCLLVNFGSPSRCGLNGCQTQ